SIGWNTICFAEPGFTRVLAHAGYVVAETTALSYIAVWMQRDAVQAAELRQMVDRLSTTHSDRINLDVANTGLRSAGARELASVLEVVARAVARVRGAAVSVHESLRHITETNGNVQNGATRQAQMVREAVAAIDAIDDTSVAGRDQAAGA